MIMKENEIGNESLGSRVPENVLYVHTDWITGNLDDLVLRKNAITTSASTYTEQTNKVYLFTSSGTSDKSPMLAESKAKASSGILGLKKVRIEILDLTNKEIVNEKPNYHYNEVTHGSYRMNYISCNGSYDDSKFLSSAVGILELSRKDQPGKIGLCFFAISNIDDFDGLRNYITDSLMELYSSGYNKDYQIVNFHTAIEGLDLSEEYGSVIAAIVD